VLRPSYRETFRRHRLLLSLPMLLAVVVAAWSALGAQKSYESTASLWVDNPPPADSSLGNANPAITPPAEQEQLVITELLKTRDFTLAVGRRSTLASYLAAHSSQGFGPLALLSGLGGGGGLDNRIVSALSSHVTSTVAGPQVLQLSYRGATPAVATSTLGAIVIGLDQEGLRFAQQRNEGALAYYKAQVAAASQAVANARQQANAYVSQHGGVASSDPNLAALTQAEGVAGTQLTQATTNLTHAAGTLDTSGGVHTAVHVIDPPTVPTGPVSGHMKAVLAVLGGLFAGALISFLGVIALTPGRPETWEDALLGGLAPRGHRVGSPAGDVIDATITNGTSAFSPDGRFRDAPDTPSREPSLIALASDIGISRPS